jgi:hypothetical protein
VWDFVMLHAACPLFIVMKWAIYFPSVGRL